ncbi:tRNA (guanosine(37)-N1)-methyltransferase TrmD [Candidatus Gottesmanbacteria bacterium RBG_16_37_8]|uniref:tRNA (guanine-N(1)-)-methyltransferase n=1 Tax=Candidatus Gottesmanbacteria bacterium RBG_16_37_8 TaxID=1798371 RepID=A0A1F5YT25_9BACT|nr:MAG: tRNA (guanosine(37)-N1)-methyltransferase TrmD [Candidatus Gottesmanbacteria bacterium RBG_16_37_8]
MVITILTLFPEFFHSVFNSSIIGRAQGKKKILIRLVNFREFTSDRHKTVDDKPYGGGAGMLLKIDILHRALESSKIKKAKERIILLDPTGKIFNQSLARNLISYDHLILICGHYEGIDFRINNFIDEKVSIGRFILTGGEIPAMAITDSVTRLIPGVLKKEEAILNESFSNGQYFEAPQYTRPVNYRGYKVPAVLLSGNHQKISGWRKKGANKRISVRKK